MLFLISAPTVIMDFGNSTKLSNYGKSGSSLFAFLVAVALLSLLRGFFRSLFTTVLLNLVFKWSRTIIEHAEPSPLLYEDASFLLAS